MPILISSFRSSPLTTHQIDCSIMEDPIAAAWSSLDAHVEDLFSKGYSYNEIMGLIERDLASIQEEGSPLQVRKAA